MEIPQSAEIVKTRNGAKMGKHSKPSRWQRGRQSPKSVTHFSDPGVGRAAHVERPDWGQVATWTDGRNAGRLEAYAEMAARSSRGRHAADPSDAGPLPR